MIYYKIRKKSDPELFVRGTPMYHKFDNTGRIFQKLGHLRTFLTGVMGHPYKEIDISDWEIVELEMVVKEVKNVHEVLTPKKIKELLLK